MPYDPSNHHRKSNRLASFDYSSPGAYFVTLVTWNRIPLLSEIKDDNIVLCNFGEIAQQIWSRLPVYFSVTLDEVVWMPDHVHAIFWIHDTVENHEPDKDVDPNNSCFHGTKRGSLGAIIQYFKAETTRRINLVRKTKGAPFWHRDYYDHVIRDDQDLGRVRQYIQQNPFRWPKEP